jgi:hypothetical protein
MPVIHGWYRAAKKNTDSNRPALLLLLEADFDRSGDGYLRFRNIMLQLAEREFTYIISMVN